MTSHLFPLLPIAYLGRNPSILKSIAEPNAYLALWHRPVPAKVADWIASWRKDCDPALDAVLPVEEVKVAVARALIDAGCPGTGEVGWLSDDIQRLAIVFSELADQPRIRLRLETVRDNGCAKFHVDTLMMRLLCTYAGPGTEWVPAGSSHRDYLGWTEGSTEEANARIVPDANSIQVMVTGAVAIFKGRLHPGFEAHGLIHRSAPVCCEKEHRLRLCLDYS